MTTPHDSKLAITHENLKALQSSDLFRVFPNLFQDYFVFSEKTWQNLAKNRLSLVSLGFSVKRMRDNS